MQNIRVAAVQFNHAPGDKEKNLETIRGFIEEAHQKNVQILSFPEMCITGYWHVRNLSREEILTLAEPVPDGPSVRMIRSLAIEKNMIIGAGLIEVSPDDRIYNCYIVCLPEGEVKWHRKMHCFISEHFSSGNEYTVFDTDLGIRLGLLTCWDNNLIENVRITALMGADVLLAPHQTGGCDSRSPYSMGLIDPKLWHNRKQDPKAIEEEFRGPKGRGWLMRWLPARAHDNGMFLIFSNGVGLDDNEVRTGNAMILDPYGRIITETWKADDAMVVADLDMGLLDMSTGRRWLRGRRPELYKELTKPQGTELSAREARFSKKGTK